MRGSFFTNRINCYKGNDCFLILHGCVLFLFEQVKDVRSTVLFLRLNLLNA